MTTAQSVKLSAHRFPHQNPPHRLRRRRKEVPPTIPLLGLLHIHQPQIGLVHQRGRLQRLPRLLVSQLGGGQFAQFVVHQRQQLLGSGRVAGFDLGQDAGDVGHGDQDTAARRDDSITGTRTDSRLAR